MKINWTKFHFGPTTHSSKPIMKLKSNYHNFEIFFVLLIEKKNQIWICKKVGLREK